MTVGRFIAGIGALIRDPRSDEYLLLRRSDQKDVGAGTWECVTGRVDQGEGFEDALFRETQEEIGVPIQIEYLIGTTHFHRGPPEPENELVGVLYSCTVQDRSQVRFGPEHDQMRWMSTAQVAEFLPPDHWLHWLIARAELLRAAIPAEVGRRLREEGFEAR